MCVWSGGRGSCKRAPKGWGRGGLAVIPREWMLMIVQTWGSAHMGSQSHRENMAIDALYLHQWFAQLTS